MIQQLTISIDVPDGYEATGEYRNPRNGEWYINSFGGIVVSNYSADLWRSCQKRIILRKKWSFPAWFKKGWWLYKSDCSGSWVAGDYSPTEQIGKALASFLWESHGETFIPPPCDKIQCV